MSYLYILLPRRICSNSERHQHRSFLRFFICELPLDDKSLYGVRKVQIAVEFGCGPDFADFDAATIASVVH